MGSIIVLIVIIGLAIFSCWITGKKHVDSGDVYVPTQSQSSDSEKITVSKKNPYGKILKFFLSLFVIDVIRYVYFYSTYGYHLGSPIFDFFLLAIGAGLCCLIYACMFAGNSSHFDRTTLTEIGEQILKRNGEKELLDFAESSGEEELLNLRSRYLQEDEPSPAILGELQIAYFKSLKADNPEAVYRTAGELGLSYAEAVNIAEIFGDKLDINVAQQLWSAAYYEREQSLKHPAAPEE